MGILIDTSILIDWERTGGKGSPVLPRVASGQYYLSVVTLSELLVGTHRGRPEGRARRAELATQLLSGVVVLDIDVHVAHTHSRLTAEMLNTGRPMAAHDLWIAATAVHHDLEIWTRDMHSFPHIPGVKLFGM